MNEISITKHGKGYRLHAVQRFLQRCEAVFPFFADAANLQQITPAHLHFQILSSLPIEMCKDAVIDYRIRIRGIPVHWQTKITAWEPPHRFADMQLRGPYKWWMHEHTFEQSGDETIATDIVEYGVPFGWLAHPLLVRNDLYNIFTFRQQVLAQRFGTA